MTKKQKQEIGKAFKHLTSDWVKGYDQELFIQAYRLGREHAGSVDMSQDEACDMFAYLSDIKAKMKE